MGKTMLSPHAVTKKRTPAHRSRKFVALVSIVAFLALTFGLSVFDKHPSYPKPTRAVNIDQTQVRQAPAPKVVYPANNDN